MLLDTTISFKYYCVISIFKKDHRICGRRLRRTPSDELKRRKGGTKTDPYSDDFERHNGQIKIGDALDIAADRFSKEAMFIIGYSGKPVSGSRLHRLALIYEAVHVRDGSAEADFACGYSEGIEEAAETLEENGIISVKDDSYALTGYGEKVFDLLKALSDGDERDMFSVDMRMMISASEDVPDAHLIALTCWYYPELASDPELQASAGPVIEGLYLDGRRLAEVLREEFVYRIWSGEKLETRRTKRLDDEGPRVRM
jgi:hypothetical protein